MEKEAAKVLEALSFGGERLVGTVLFCLRGRSGHRLPCGGRRASGSSGFPKASEHVLPRGCWGIT